MNSTIDWTGQLEAYHEDGRVVRVTVYTGPDEDGDRAVMPWLDGVGRIFGEDGTPWSNNGWRIRNASQTLTEAPQATSPILPSTEQLDRFEALLVRLEGILRGIGKGEAA